MYSIFRYIAVITGVIFFTTACSTITYTVSEDIARSLSSGIANQSDIELVKTGIPSYVLLLDGMITENPDSPELYLAGAKLYGTYANFVYDDPERVDVLSRKAFNYSKKSLCLTASNWCGADKQPIDKYLTLLADVTADNLEVLYTFGVTWASYIDSHNSDWDAIADLPKVKATMQRILELDDAFEEEGAHL